jgi:DNA-directed RNA polymerase specialized sigma24 family protein
MIDETVDRVDARLREWAQWASTGGRSVGFPVINVLHSNWQPGRGMGRLPATHSGARHERERQTHEAIQTLSVRLQDTLVVHYVKRGTCEQQASALGCKLSTLHARLREARHQVGEWLKR